MVTAKKHLGQHFLNDETYCQRIVDAFNPQRDPVHALEIGPGAGAITGLLFQREDLHLFAIDIDTESIAHLKSEFPDQANQMIETDFLKMDIDPYLKNGQVGIIGNFPYNISSQILFKVYEERSKVNEVVGMFQKEVAQRVAAGPGSKTYGILSVLLQAFYDIEYLFTVPPGVFIPPPKVDSGVIRLVRNDVTALSCDEKKFFKVVKTAFNQRRKMLRKSLSGMRNGKTIPFEDKRPEQLSVPQFVELTKALEK